MTLPERPIVSKLRSNAALKVMVLAGGPDRERSVSLKSGRAVAQALRQAGHQVLERDVVPTDLAALDEWKQWRGQVIFPVVHGSWGEGGSLQRILDQRCMPYVGSRAPAADLCMDKHRTKVMLSRHGLPTPCFELIRADDKLTIEPPLVLKAPREGSSIDLAVCDDAVMVSQARQQLQHQPVLLAEQFISGKELTIGVISNGKNEAALPPILIVPNTQFYDYQAKYRRNDTQYVLDPREIGLPEALMDKVRHLAVETHRVLGCRHLSRIDLMIDNQCQPWILEINTAPGFTGQSLLPKAAAYAGLPLPVLVDRLLALAIDDP